MIPVTIRRDHNGDPYEDPPVHLRDRQHKDRESANYMTGMVVINPADTRDARGFDQLRFYAALSGVRVAVIDAGQQEPAADIILIRKTKP